VRWTVCSTGRVAKNSPAASTNEWMPVVVDQATPDHLIRQSACRPASGRCFVRGSRPAYTLTRKDPDDSTLWQEWEQASEGRRQLTWSEGIRALAGLAEQERSDEDIAEELGDDDLLILDRDT
jgi:hypothetical protein